MKDSTVNITGDIFICSSIIAYMGGFDKEYRIEKFGK